MVGTLETVALSNPLEDNKERNAFVCRGATAWKKIRHPKHRIVAIGWARTSQPRMTPKPSRPSLAVGTGGHLKTVFYHRYCSRQSLQVFSPVVLALELVAA